MPIPRDIPSDDLKTTTSLVDEFGLEIGSGPCRQQIAAGQIMDLFTSAAPTEAALMSLLLDRQF